MPLSKAGWVKPRVLHCLRNEAPNSGLSRPASQAAPEVPGTCMLLGHGKWRYAAAAGLLPRVLRRSRCLNAISPAMTGRQACHMGQVPRSPVAVSFWGANCSLVVPTNSRHSSVLTSPPAHADMRGSSSYCGCGAEGHGERLCGYEMRNRCQVLCEQGLTLILAPCGALHSSSGSEK